MRLIVCLGLGLMLSGCSLFSSDGDPDPAEMTEMSRADAPLPAAPTAPADDSFCRDVAAGDATGHGFDQATQTRMAQQSFAQCKAIFAR